MSRSSTLFVLPAVVLVALFSLSALHAVEGIKCYICSWSVTDLRPDVCTRTNFKVPSTHIFDCEKGCETVTLFDKNGGIDFFYRSCADRHNSTITGTCNNVTGTTFTKEVCDCNSDYCNKNSEVEQNIDDQTLKLDWKIILLSALSLFPAFTLLL